MLIISAAGMSAHVTEHEIEYKKLKAQRIPLGLEILFQGSFIFSSGFAPYDSCTCMT